MKKILYLLLILILFFACYLIYYNTEKNEDNYLFVGDKIFKNDVFSNIGNTCFVNEEYRTLDLINILKYNQEVECFENGNVSLHYLLNQADYLFVSIGINDVIFNVNNNANFFYHDANYMIKDIEFLLKIICNYDYKRVVFIGYVNSFDKSDYIDYLNYNLKKNVKKYGYDFFDINSYFRDKNLLNDGDYLELSKILVEKYKKY